MDVPTDTTIFDASGIDMLVAAIVETVSRIPPDENVFSLGQALAPRRPYARIHFCSRGRGRGRSSGRSSRSDTDEDQKEDETEEGPSIVWAPRDWSQPPASGYIRILHEPTQSLHACLQDWWMRDRTLMEWLTDMQKLEADLSGNTIAAAISPPNYAASVRELFYNNQRQRWLARWAIQRWRYGIWKRCKSQCAVDLIEMNPVAERDAVYLMDTRVRCVYCFHHRDIFHNLLSNLSMADEMFPTPRVPTNPWTNAPLTLAQTISVCQQLMAAWGRIGRAPTVLFAAFCAAGYDVVRLRTEHSSLLAQEAIRSYFKDLTEDTQPVVYDTMMQIFAEMGLNVSPIAVRRWLREGTPTTQHRAWLHFVRDYTLYINLHVQVRPDWVDEDAINRDAARLLAATQAYFPNTVSARVRNLRLRADELRSGPVGSAELAPLTMTIPLSLQMLDISGSSAMEMDLALQLIQSALFRM
jgi:hypothetical protein